MTPEEQARFEAKLEQSRKRIERLEQGFQALVTNILISPTEAHEAVSRVMGYIDSRERASGS